MTVGVAAAPVHTRRGIPASIGVVDSVQTGGWGGRRETRLLGAAGARRGRLWHSAVVVRAGADGIAAGVADADLDGPVASPCGRAI